MKEAKARQQNSHSIKTYLKNNYWCLLSSINF